MTLPEKVVTIDIYQLSMRKIRISERSEDKGGHKK